MNSYTQLTVPLTSAVPIHCGYDAGKALLLQPKRLRKSKYVPRSFVQHNYHDRSGELPDSSDYFAQNSVPPLFPQKLHQVLDLMCADGFAHVCSWQPHGRAFVMHKPREFEAIMPRYFGKMKYSSFQRQLNLYGFMRLTHGPDRGGYYHECFLRGREFLCHRVQRIRVKGNGSRSASNPDAEPNFYAMPPVGALPPAAVPLARALPRRGLPSNQVSLNERDLVKALQPQPAKPASASPLQRGLLVKRVSLDEHDFVQALQGHHTPAELPCSPASSSDTEPDSDDSELDESLWNSMELLLDNLGEPDGTEMSPADTTGNDPMHLSSLGQTAPQELAEPIAAPTVSPWMTAKFSEAPKLDHEVANFLKMLFFKEDSGEEEGKGNSMGGSKNAAVFARHGAFSRQNSQRNAAA